MVEKALIMEESAVKRALERISHEILEKNKGTSGLFILGIQRRGAALADFIAESIKNIEGVEVPCGSIDIRRFRDDLKQPILGKTELPFDVEGKKIVLVDDVLYTGRTARAAIEAVFSVGRPAMIQFAVLIDRGHRELPIRADYVGKNIPTAKSELISVSIPPFDPETSVRLLG